MWHQIKGKALTLELKDAKGINSKQFLTDKKFRMKWIQMDKPKLVAFLFPAVKLDFNSSSGQEKKRNRYILTYRLKWNKDLKTIGRHILSD